MNTTCTSLSHILTPSDCTLEGMARDPSYRDLMMRVYVKANILHALGIAENLALVMAHAEFNEFEDKPGHKFWASEVERLKRAPA